MSSILKTVFLTGAPYKLYGFKNTFPRSSSTSSTAVKVASFLTGKLYFKSPAVLFAFYIKLTALYRFIDYFLARKNRASLKAVWKIKGLIKEGPSHNNL